jgi:DNA invertase Pin-like site-specific DNA recombinase
LKINSRNSGTSPRSRAGECVASSLTVRVVPRANGRSSRRCSGRLVNEKFDVLLFWSLDRLSREGVLETLQHLNRLTSYGVNYRSFTEQYFDSCGILKDAFISILATIAKQERIRISERVEAGLAQAKAKGRRLGRPAVEVDAAKVQAMRREGRSFEEIGEALGVSASSAWRAAREAA